MVTVMTYRIYFIGADPDCGVVRSETNKDNPVRATSFINLTASGHWVILVITECDPTHMMASLGSGLGLAGHCSATAI
jgi:hypothetical protein